MSTPAECPICATAVTHGCAVCGVPCGTAFVCSERCQREHDDTERAEIAAAMEDWQREQWEARR